MKHRILLVEDNDMNRDMLSRRLARTGYTVTTAATGPEAFVKVTAERPDVILMDMSLPEIDGWECTRRLKNTAETSGIPIVALTAYAMREDRRRAMVAGCNAFLTKPVNYARLLETLRRLSSFPEPAV